ncbi:hypothetical protein DAI22_09g079200 [Oryza sativa Japonica Group]|jgi:hypothetical protein|uniref:cDNA clone:J013051A10, full insert sequence n=1 Tax=Oryza sativa subsp. japonica TaxID=39947 RepID=B7EBU9_ORYSJ|nr:hypothetical protein DAI22_09g079200 [Oryza sativa Japonica Group]BAG89846.1 unnamed protein product [Oryza sativa Japonica Group]
MISCLSQILKIAGSILFLMLFVTASVMTQVVQIPLYLFKSNPMMQTLYLVYCKRTQCILCFEAIDSQIRT